MDQQKVPSASPGPNEQGSTLSIRVPVELRELLHRARWQFSDPGANPCRSPKWRGACWSQAHNIPAWSTSPRLRCSASNRPKHCSGCVASGKTIRNSVVRSGSFWRGTRKKDASSMAFHLTRRCLAVNPAPTARSVPRRMLVYGVTPTRSWTTWPCR